MSVVEKVEDDSAEIARQRYSEGKKAERRLGLMLVAPAVILMIAVTAYPIAYAIYLSLFRADLRTPDDNEFVGLDNYVTVLTSDIWWQAFGFTLLLTVVSVAFELALGMGLAIVMHRTIVGRGLVRTSALVPYAIVTVVAAFSWRFAWSQDIGWLAGDSAPLTGPVAAYGEQVKNGVTLLIDPMSIQYLTGADIDYKESVEGSQFVIRNPNASSTCGCGSSFSV